MKLVGLLPVVVAAVGPVVDEGIDDAGEFSGEELFGLVDGTESPLDNLGAEKFFRFIRVTEAAYNAAKARKAAGGSDNVGG